MKDTFYDRHEGALSPCKVWRRSHNARRLQVRKCGFFYRQDAVKRQPAGIVFTQQPKINILPPSGKTMNQMEKWMTSFMMGTTSSTIMQSLGEIEQRAPAVGAKMWCLFFVFFYRQDCRVAGNCRYCFYSQAKNQVFRPVGANRYTDSGQTLQDRPAPGSAWLCKISRQSVQRAGNAAPKISKISTFW